MKWFKHYNASHDGQTFGELWAENDTETIAFYWTILEMVSRWEDQNKRGCWTGNLSIFRRKLNMKSGRSRRLLTKISQRFQVNLEWISDESFQLLIPNWSELQENRGRFKTQKIDKNPGEVRSKKLEVRNKNKKIQKEKPLQPDGFAEFYSSYPRKVGKTAAIKAYQRELASGGDQNLILDAVRRYSEYLKGNDTDSRYVKHPATFLSGWRDYLEPDYGATSLPTKESSEDKWEKFKKRWEQT